MNSLKGKKVLLMGLGILGGGAASARWLAQQGAILTITDMKSAEALATSLAKLGDIKKKISFVLGEHREGDFVKNDIIVVNPDVPASSPFIKIARDHGKKIENELTLFYAACPSRTTVAITGTRGKTTTVNWTRHFLADLRSNALITGNSPENPLLGTLSKIGPETPVVIEAPSFLLELAAESDFAPHVAVITNVFQDHLNRHGTLENYAAIKGNIFRKQKAGDFVILNHANEWTEYFTKQKPQSKMLFFFNGELPAGKEGIFVGNGEMILRIDSKEQVIMPVDAFIAEWGAHNLENLMAASLAAIVGGLNPERIAELSSELPQVRYRQEKIFENDTFKIYNDTAATSPDATIAALGRFSQDGNAILIAGGTDRDLDFKEWASEIKKSVKPENLILLGGTATEKMKKELGEIGFGAINEKETLEECVRAGIGRAKNSGLATKAIILFSPSAKSFGKFKNEFDRGEQFESLVERLTV